MSLTENVEDSHFKDKGDSQPIHLEPSLRYEAKIKNKEKSVCIVSFGGLACKNYKGAKSSIVLTAQKIGIYDEIYAIDQPQAWWYAKDSPNQDNCYGLTNFKIVEEIWFESFQKLLHKIKPFKNVTIITYSMSGQIIVRIWKRIKQEIDLIRNEFNNQYLCKCYGIFIAVGLRMDINSRHLLRDFFTLENLANNKTQIMGPVYLASSAIDHGSWKNIVRCGQVWCSGEPSGSNFQFSVDFDDETIEEIRNDPDNFFVAGSHDCFGKITNVFFGDTQPPKPIIDFMPYKKDRKLLLEVVKNTPFKRTKEGIAQFYHTQGNHISLWSTQLAFVDAAVRHCMLFTNKESTDLTKQLKIRSRL